MAGLVGQCLCLFLLVLCHCLCSVRIAHDLVADVVCDFLLLVFPVRIFLGVGLLVGEFGLSVGDVRQRACLACGFDLFGHFGDHVFDGLDGLIDLAFGGLGEFIPLGGGVGETYLRGFFASLLEVIVGDFSELSRRSLERAVISEFLGEVSGGLFCGGEFFVETGHVVLDDLGQFVRGFPGLLELFRQIGGAGFGVVEFFENFFQSFFEPFFLGLGRAVARGVFFTLVDDDGECFAASGLDAFRFGVPCGCVENYFRCTGQLGRGKINRVLTGGMFVRRRQSQRRIGHGSTVSGYYHRRPHHRDVIAHVVYDRKAVAGFEADDRLRRRRLGVSLIYLVAVWNPQGHAWRAVGQRLDSPAEGFSFEPEFVPGVYFPPHHSGLFQGDRERVRAAFGGFYRSVFPIHNCLDDADGPVEFGGNCHCRADQRAWRLVVFEYADHRLEPGV